MQNPLEVLKGLHPHAARRSAVVTELTPTQQKRKAANRAANRVARKQRQINRKRG